MVCELSLVNAKRCIGRETNSEFKALLLESSFTWVNKSDKKRGSHPFQRVSRIKTESMLWLHTWNSKVCVNDVRFSSFVGNK